VDVSVTDTGTGMSDEVRAKAFEPFFTTKAEGKGSGLGLSMVLGVAQQSGGDVRIRSRAGEGTSIEVYLPLFPGYSEYLPGSGQKIPGYAATGIRPQVGARALHPRLTSGQVADGGPSLTNHRMASSQGDVQTET
jgi:hypothetical protein